MIVRAAHLRLPIIVALSFLLAVAFALVLLTLTDHGTATAGSIVVNESADELNSDGDCSLREAITAANTDAVVDACTAGGGADTITLPAGTYTFSIAGAGENAAAAGDLDITDDLTITGDGADSTTIDAAALDRVFHVDPVDSGITVNISGVTIQGGNPGDSGGGVQNRGNLTLERVTVTGNTAFFGGGMAVTSGTATLTDTTVDGNISEGAGGGGIFTHGDLMITNSTISNNTEEGFAGGGIYNDSGTVMLTNSTVSGNSAKGDGGGLWNDFGDLSLLNTTVTDNASTDGFGGGVINEPNASTLTIKNTIIAGNGASGDCAGIITSVGYNISGDNSCGLASIGDMSNTDAKLAPLGANGGQTQTHALMSDSPAIDNASPDCPPPDTDQRGMARPQGLACDIGSFETPVAATPTVTPTPINSITPTPTTTSTATPTPIANALWGDDDCDGDADAVDALKNLQHVAALPFTQSDPCFPLGDPVSVTPTGPVQRLWGDVDCDNDVDAVDALAILRKVAALSVNQQPGCPEIGSPILAA